MTVLLAALLLAAVPDAGVPLALKVEGDLVKNGSLALKELIELGAVTVDWTDAHAKNPEAAACAPPAQKNDRGCGHKVTGIRLDRVLLRLGFSEGQTGPRPTRSVSTRGFVARSLRRPLPGSRQCSASVSCSRRSAPPMRLSFGRWTGSRCPRGWGRSVSSC